ncbi:MAG TPA: hypothetical protein ENK31_00535, partial [Nannocystis exedens]|nr:hypothetical protein [Nannocystis exedens]
MRALVGLVLDFFLLAMLACTAAPDDGGSVAREAPGREVKKASDVFAPPPPSQAKDALPSPRPPALTRERTVLEEARSDFSHVQVVQQGRRRSLIFLRERGGELVQTTIEVHHADRLTLAYAQAQAAALLLVPRPQRVLILGLGGGTLPRFFHRMIPGAKIDAVEIDPVVVRLAAQWFGVEAGPRLRVFTEDAIAFIAAAKQHYDLIYVDAFLEPNQAGVDNSGIPLALRKRTILADLRAHLSAGGAAIFNLHFRSGYAEQVSTIAEVFGRRYIVKVKGSSQRHIIAFAESGPPLDPQELAKRAAILDRDGRFGVDFAALVGQISVL